MSYQPSRLSLGSARRDSAQSAANNARIMLSLNPFMANNPDALMHVASSTTDIDELLDFGVASYGLAVGNNMAAELQGMDPSRQRSVYGQLTTNQQMALQAIGYKEPARDDGGLFSDIMGGVGKVLSVPMRGISEIGVGDFDIGHGVGAAMKGLAWVGNQPGHLYRTIRLQDDASQWMALLGAVAGGAAVIGSGIITGGASLAALGLIGGGALLGAGATSLATSSIINPGDWFRAWNESWDGERTFDLAARRKADELLGDPRLVGLAQDMAELDGLSLEDLAAEIAGLRSSSDGDRLGVLNKLARRMGEEGTPEYQQAFQSMLNVLSVPQFQEAVQTLQNGKMSPGRDLADAFGLDPGTGLHNLVSGTVDLGFTLAVDPFLVFGAASKVQRAVRHGVRIVDKVPVRAALMDRFADDGVRLYHSKIVDAVNGVELRELAEGGAEVVRRSGIVNTAALRSVGGSYKRIVPELQMWMKKQEIAPGNLTVEQFQDFLAGSGDITPLMRGVGTVQIGQRLVIEDYSHLRGAYRSLAQSVRATVQGMTDEALEKAYTKRVLKAAGEEPDMMALLPPTAQEYVSKAGLIETPWLYQQERDQAYMRGREVIGKVLPDWLPVGQVIQAMTTMAPAGKALSLVGDNAFRDVLAMTETGSLLGMPSWVRRAWADAIITSKSTGAKHELALTFLDNALTIAGGRSDERLAELVDEYLTKSRQVYGVNDSMFIAGRMRNLGTLSSQQADEILMPSFKELRRYAMRGKMAKFMGIADLDIAEAAINRVWKPAVLLRLAFIPRAVGEEGLAFLLRGGIGGLVQDFGARSIADMKVYDSANAKVLSGNVLSMTEGEKTVWMRGPWARLPKHVRGLMWTMDHIGWGDATFKMLDTYGELLRGSLAKGLGVEAAQMGAAKAPRKLIGEVRQPWSVSARDAAEAVLLGDRYSWRRMVLGGVDHDAVDAAVAFRSKFQTQMMRSLSATSAVEFGTVDDPRYIEVRETQARAMGKMKRQEFVSVPGERELSSVADDAGRHNVAVLRRIKELHEDPVIAQAASQVVSLIKGGRIKMADEDVLELLENMRTLSPAMRNIVYEFLNNPQRDATQAMIGYLRGKHRELADVLSLAKADTDPDFDEFVELVDAWAVKNRRGLDDQLDADRADAMDESYELSTPEEPAFMAEARRRRMMTRDELEQERIDRMAAQEGDPIDDWDGYFDEVDYFDNPLEGQLTADEAYRREKLRRELEIEHAADEFARVGEPWDGWFYDERGLPIDPDMPNATPEYLARLRDRQDELDVFEAEEAIIKWHVADADVKAFRGELISQADADVQLFEDELLRLGGSIDARTGRVVFHIHPSSSTGGEWDWWQQLDSRRRRGLAQRFFRRWGGPQRNRAVTSIDVLASEANLTVDEWADQFVRFTSRYEDARRARSAYKKMPLKELREATRQAQLDELERFRPDIDPAIRDEVARVEQSLNDPRRRAMADAWRRQQRRREIPTGEDVEPDIYIPLTRAEEDLERRRSLERMEFAEDDRAELMAVDNPNVVDPKDARRAAREAEAEAQMRARVNDRIPLDDSWWMDEPELVTQKLYSVDFDPETADGWARELKRMQPLIQFLRSQDDATRGFLAQLIRTMDRPGTGVQLSVMRRKLSDGQPLFYKDFDEAHEDFVRALQSSVMNPYYNDAVQRSERVGDVTDDTMVRLYPVADFMKVKELLAQQNTRLTYDMILQHATDRKLIESNRDIVRAIVHTPRSGQSFLVTADPRLAAELKGIQSQMRLGHRVVSDQRSLVVSRDLLDGRVLEGGAVVPLHKRMERMKGKHGNERTELWQLDHDMFAHRLEATPKPYVDRAREWAETMAENYRYFTTMQSKALKRPRMLMQEDGTETPLLFTYGTGELRPLTREDMLNPSADNKLKIVDAKGNPVDVSRTEYFDDVEAEVVGAEPAWEALGGVFEDMMDERFAGVRTLPKQESKFASGRAIQSLDSVRVYRARVEHVERLGSAKPPIAWIERTEPRFDSAWDRFVRWGFDKVIGGSIDAILRRPMAFHYFKQRYITNRNLMRWVIDPDLERKTETIRDQVASLSGAANDVGGAAAGARRLALADGAKAEKWTDSEALAWLRGHSETELADRITKVHDAAVLRGDTALAREMQELAGVGPTRLRAAMEPGVSAENFLRYVESQLPPGLLQKPSELFSAKGRRLIDSNPVLQHLTTDDWETLRALDKNLSHLRDGASEAAAIAAVEDMLPFIDSHEFKTQFGEFGKGFLPFWYAEENFLKRWVRGFAMEGPAYIRKAQLGYMGLKQAGVIRTDENGKDWFVYPGSTLLADAVSKVAPNLGLITQGIMFQTPTDALLPGLNQRFGTPAFNPLVTVPVEFLGMLDPAFKPIEAALSGGAVTDRGVWEQIVPTQLLRFYNAFRGDEESSKQHASAMMAAIAQLEANDQGLPDNATPFQREEFLDKVREHARIIVFAQALAGFVSPGAPSQLTASPEAGFLGLGVEDPADVLNAQYLQLVRGLGLEAGTQEFLARHPLATIHDVVNPLAYTQSRSETFSGARIGATTKAVEWYDENEDYLKELSYAGPWLLPQEYITSGARSEVAYDQATALGLRSRLTPDEFLGNIKFKSASTEYFQQKTRFDDAIAVAQSRGDQVTVEKLKARWDEYSTLFRAAHPIFDDELTSGAAKERRTKVIDEMRVAVTDPLAPQSDRLTQLRTVMDLYDRYRAHLGILGQDRSAAGRSKVERLKANYQKTMNDMVSTSPSLQSFWLGVLRPESSLD